MDIELRTLLLGLIARPFHITFMRQRNTARKLYGAQLEIPKFTRAQIMEVFEPLLDYYAQRAQGIIADRVCEVILTRQRN